MSIEIKEANSVNDTVTEAEKLEKLEAKKAEAKELLRALVAAGSHLGLPTRRRILRWMPIFTLRRMAYTLLMFL